MSNHTPGPWKIGKELSAACGEWLISMDCGDRAQGMCIAETRSGTGAEIANARLIAAAPEMLNALEVLVEKINNDEWFAEWSEIALAAIAKAKGETK